MHRLVTALLLFNSPDPVPASDRSRQVETRQRPLLAAPLKALGLELGAPVLLRLFKEERVAELWMRKADATWVKARQWPITALSGELGPKQREGDGQGPEGFYAVTAKALNPASAYHLSLNIGYPNAYDKAQKRTGSFIMIHGGAASIGYFALGDPAIEEVWTLTAAALRQGQKEIEIHAYPFHLSEANLTAYATSPWIPFWRELKAPYDRFEKTPGRLQIDVKFGQYRLP
jgi:murein L,D-transpeptidase YafK